MPISSKKFKMLFSSKRVLGALAVVSVYLLMVDINLAQTARLLADHEELRSELPRQLITSDLGGGACTIAPTDDAPPALDNATHTLLVSYPGSGKRFTWTVIKALTNSEVADDWNFSEKLGLNPLTIKTSWPHKEGKWSWGKSMDQVIYLIRNPRWAIPSYHNMRFELDYAADWTSSYLRIPNTYSERPAVNQWELWRDSQFKMEMKRWISHVDFWMEGKNVSNQLMALATTYIIRYTATANSSTCTIAYN